MEVSAQGSRSREYQIRYLDLSPLAGNIVEHLMSGLPLGDAVRLWCQEKSEPLSDEVLAGTATILAALAERGVLLGVS